MNSARKELHSHAGRIVANNHGSVVRLNSTLSACVGKIMSKYSDQSRVLAPALKAMHAEAICGFLWPPYGIGQAIIFLPCGFYLSFRFGLSPKTKAVTTLC